MIIDRFIEQAKKEGMILYGIMVVRKGMEPLCRSFGQDDAHNVYSIAKSVVSTAVGIAMDRGLLSLSDRPAAFFPEFMTGKTDPAWERVTLRHLLTMTSGQDRPYMMEAQRKALRESPEGKKDWLYHVFSLPMVHEPGRVFSYGNQCPYLAGRMLEKASGTDLETFIQTFVFDPLGIPAPRWEKDPFGHLIGATGLWLRVGDMARLGTLYLNGGTWEGRRILSKEWVLAATSFQTASASINPVGTSGDMLQGYGYWFWINAEGGCRAYGRESQFILILPGAEAVIALQADHHDTREMMDLIRRTLYPALGMV